MGEKDCNCNEGDSERDESTEEQMQCKEQYICTPHGTLSPPSLGNSHVASRNGHVAIAPKQHRNESCEYAICEITNPQSYCGDTVFSLQHYQRGGSPLSIYKIDHRTHTRFA